MSLFPQRRTNMYAPTTVLRDNESIACRRLPESRKGGDADEAARAIRRVIHAQAAAIRSKNADAVIAFNLPRMRAFGIVAPLRRFDAATVRERLQHWFATFAGPLGCELRELETSIVGDTACARFLQRFSGINVSGMPIELWVRVTMGLQRIDGRWLISHEHLSDPFDPDHGTA
ncbi:MAG: nuclear transport factor 2 family protein [Rhodanobacter sp.]